MSGTDCFDCELENMNAVWELSCRYALYLTPIIDSLTGSDFLSIAGTENDRRCRVAAKIFKVLRCMMRTGL